MSMKGLCQAQPFLYDFIGENGILAELRFARLEGM